MRDLDNRPKYFVAIIEDITEKKETEHAFRNSEQHLALALRAAHLGLWNRNLLTDEVATFGKFARLYGLPADKAPRAFGEWLSLVHPEDREFVGRVVSQALNQGTEWEIEFRVCWPDGSLHWLCGKGAVYFDGSGRPVRTAGVNFDITERKKAEVALRESEGRFRNMADTVPVMIWVADTGKCVNFCNKCHLSFTGLTMEENLGDGWTEALYNEDRERFLSLYSSSIDARQEFRSAFRLRRADGEYRWVLCTGVPRFAPGGAFAGHIGSCIDITDQKLIEERLRANEVQLKNAQRIAKVGSWEQDIETGQSYWSDEYRRIMGLSSDAPSNFTAFLNCVHPKDREKTLDVERNVRSTRTPFESEFRIIRPNGEVRFVRSTVEPITNDHGALVSLAGTTQDITEQVAARDLLRDSEESLKSAQRLAHVGNWQWDIRADFVSGSEEMY